MFAIPSGLLLMKASIVHIVTLLFTGDAQESCVAACISITDPVGPHREYSLMSTQGEMKASALGSRGRLVVFPWSSAQY